MFETREVLIILSYRDVPFRALDVVPPEADSDARWNFALHFEALHANGFIDFSVDSLGNKTWTLTDVGRAEVS